MQTSEQGKLLDRFHEILSILSMHPGQGKLLRHLREIGRIFSGLYASDIKNYYINHQGDNITAVEVWKWFQAWTSFQKLNKNKPIKLREYLGKKTAESRGPLIYGIIF